MKEDLKANIKVDIKRLGHVSEKKYKKKFNR